MAVDTLLNLYMLLSGPFHHTHSQPTLAPISCTQEISDFHLFITPLTTFFESSSCKELALRLMKHSHSQKWKSCSESLVCCQQRMRRGCCMQFFFPKWKELLFTRGGKNTGNSSSASSRSSLIPSGMPTQRTRLRIVPVAWHRCV